jgi:hypothetical protein
MEKEIIKYLKQKTNKDYQKTFNKLIFNYDILKNKLADKDYTYKRVTDEERILLQELLEMIYNLY